MEISNQRKQSESESAAEVEFVVQSTGKESTFVIYGKWVMHFPRNKELEIDENNKPNQNWTTKSGTEKEKILRRDEMRQKKCLG